MTFYPHYSLSHLSKKIGTNLVNRDFKEIGGKEGNPKSSDFGQKSTKRGKNRDLERPAESRKNRQKEAKNGIPKGSKKGSKSRKIDKNSKNRGPEGIKKLEKSARVRIRASELQRIPPNAKITNSKGTGKGKSARKFTPPKSDFFRKKSLFLMGL